MLNPLRPSISMPVLHTVLLHQYANSPYCFRQVIYGSYEENLSNNQKLFRVAIFSIILMTLTFD